MRCFNHSSLSLKSKDMAIYPTLAKAPSLQGYANLAKLTSNQIPKYIMQNTTCLKVLNLI
ncbi:hypothetical protein PA3_39100 [Acinetobacter pittii]|uniref:Uncharacterized protein n=1 Tax=Acinetobacter pittii TaxID=48296 RepID=A0A4Y3JEF7_ACIPI|nr:hypothetical protein PA3_39100 [Acinetobacter pittii]